MYIVAQKLVQVQDSSWHPLNTSQVLSTNNVSFDGALQDSMDAEITYAKHAGIDYWAFDTYCKFGPNCETTDNYCKQYYEQTSTRYCPLDPDYGLNLYLSSKLRNQVNFTLVLLGSPTCRPDIAAHYVSLMKEPTFQTVMDGRPLLYLFQFDDAEAAACGGWAMAKEAFDRLRTMAQQAGLKNPYLVLMDFNVPTVKSNAAKLGFDAISTYALPGGTLQGTPFSAQLSQAQNWWSEAIRQNAKFVPLAPTGWDPRPRAENPPPWVNEGPEHYEQPTVAELQELIQSAVKVTCTNAQWVESQTILVYAWNESSENGATLIPSLGNSTIYVDALSKVLPARC